MVSHSVSMAYLLPAAMAAGLSGALSVLALGPRLRNAPNVLFCVFLVTVSLWSLLIFAMRASPDPGHALVWERLEVLGLLFSSPAFYWFACSYTRSGYNKTAVPLLLVYLVMAVGLSFSGHLIDHVASQSYGYATIFSPAFYPVALCAYIWSASGIFVLWQAHGSAKVFDERNRLSYILIGSVFPLIGTIVDPFPSLIPASVLGNLAFGAVAIYAIRRYHLPDIALVIRKCLVYVAVILVVAGVYVAVMGIARRMFNQAGSALELSLLLVLALVLALALALQPFWQRVRQRVEATLDRERSVLAAILAGMTEGLVVIDAEGNIIWWNTAMAEFSGTQAEAVLGKPFAEVLQSKVADLEDSGSVGRVLEAIAKSSGGTQTFDLALALPQPRDLSGKAFRISSAQGEELTCLLVRDITQERELEERRNTFVSIVSHELRTPMTTILGYSELMLQGDVPRATGQKWLGTINRDTMRLSALVDDLLNMSRIQSGKVKVTPALLTLPEIVAEAATVAMSPDGPHPLSIELPMSLPEVWADRDKVQQVLINLLTNAVKYSPRGGPIIVSAEEDMEGGCVNVTVTDRGMGISTEDIPKLFQGFERLARSETNGIRGTGIGLYIVKSFVELMGGRVWVKSEVGKGSTFGFSLKTLESEQLIEVPEFVQATKRLAS